MISGNNQPENAQQPALPDGQGPTTAPSQQENQPPIQPGPRRPRLWLAVLMTMLVALLFGGVVFAAGWEFGHAGSAPSGTIPPQSSNTIDAVREAVIAKVSPGVVQINVQTANGSAIGSGVIIDKRGYIVTNNHVVAGARGVEVVFSNGFQERGQIVGTDPADDLAVIKVNPPSHMVVVPLGNSSNLRVGQEVLAIGNPLGNTQTVTNGIISALNRNVTDGPSGAIIPGAIQTDAPINPGNSGGALVNLQGQLIGIPTLAAIDPEFNTPANGVGFAIPSNRVGFIVPQIIQYGRVIHTGRAALGVSVTSVSPLIAAQDNLSVNHGALIAGVVNGGGAAKAGLQVGEVIVQVGNTPVTNATSLGDALIQYSPGQTVAVHIVRGNQQLTINVTLGELQASS
jgi:S1-C subfamily serine protease